MNTKAVGALLAVLVILIVGAIIWARSQKQKDGTDVATPVMSVTAFNQTQSTNAASKDARPGDVIIYTLTAENQSDEVISGYVLEVNVADVSKYATLTDASGASFNSATNSLVWTPLDISPNQSIEKNITVRVNSLPAGSNTALMKMKFNNESNINIVSAPQATGNQNTNSSSGKVAGAQDQTYKSPRTGPQENLVVLMAGLSTLGYWLIKRRNAIQA